MARRTADETVDRTYALTRAPSGLALSIAREGFEAFIVDLPASGVVTVGRDASASLTIASPSLSRLHFSIDLRGDVASVRDLGSRNGTLLDHLTIGEVLAPFGLASELVAGDVRFTLLRPASVPGTARRFELLGSLEAALVAAREGVVVTAIALEAPVNQGGSALDVLSQLPEECALGLASDTVIVIASTDETISSWLCRTLVERGARIARSTERKVTRGAPSIVTSVLRDLLEAPPSVDVSTEADVPSAFRYPSLRKIHDDLRRFATRAISLSVTGETGTGKEVVAREIHRLSGRPGPLVAINAAALPESLIESELFGHEKGAFSGALTAKAGLIETSDGGTLFLDEIGELSLPLQAKLLRVLEDRKVRRVGATAERSVDLRIVAATHQDLDALVREKRFRQDLLFRINGASIVLPPLRERRGEIGSLARQLLLGIVPARPPVIAADAERALEAYAWPGNVRELKHVLERAAAFADAGTILLEHLPPALARVEGSQADLAGTDVRSTVRDFERDRIVQALAAAGGNRTKAAEILGLPRRTLVYKLSKLRLKDE